MNSQNPVYSSNRHSSANQKEENTSEKPAEKKIFQCSNCELSEEYHYFGKRPPFCKSILFTEDSYVIRDPFTAQGGNNANFLLLGSKCSLCAKMTCQDCSLFFTVRLCSVCSQKNSQLLPEELLVKKKKTETGINK